MLEVSVEHQTPFLNFSSRNRVTDVVCLILYIIRLVLYKNVVHRIPILHATLLSRLSCIAICLRASDKGAKGNFDSFYPGAPFVTCWKGISWITWLKCEHQLVTHLLWFHLQHFACGFLMRIVDSRILCLALDTILSGFDKESTSVLLKGQSTSILFYFKMSCLFSPYPWKVAWRCVNLMKAIKTGTHYWRSQMN